MVILLFYILSLNLHSSSIGLTPKTIGLVAFKHIHKKRGASSVPGPRFEGLRITLSVEPSNAESPTLMYIYHATIIIDEHDSYTSKGRSRCFGLDRQFGRLRSSQSVKPKAFRKRLLYVCVPFLLNTYGFLHSEGHCKDKYCF